MTTYTAITIGPLGHTFSLARKAKEFWTASAMFSYLMKIIVEQLSEKAILLSPAKYDGQNLPPYPDRAFFEGKIDNLVELLKEVRTKAAKDLGIDGSYFNIMATFDEFENTKTAIQVLNKRLDVLELNNKATNGDIDDAVRQRLGESIDCLKGQKNMDLKDIARAYGAGRDFSYSRYICIVQADGDSMGKAVAAESDNGTLAAFSEKLLKFGRIIRNEILEFGALPIYIGGDDLLFIAPVVGNVGDEGMNIIDFVTKVIDAKYKEAMGEDTTLSYGISITYHKFPLYEAWEKARELLRDAKNVDKKNAISWCLQKHAGSSFKGCFSKNNISLLTAFDELIKESGQKDSIVSAVSHKLRSNSKILELFAKCDETERQDRIDAFYKNTIDDKESKSYKDATKCVLKELCKVFHEKLNQGTVEDKDEKETEKNNVSIMAYGMIRTAKFICGESIRKEEKEDDND